MERENFGSKFGAILATAGSAVGLGNIWRFPVEVGKNGGAAFILIYIGCILLLGLPLMLSEFIIGRHTQSNATGAYHKLAPNPMEMGGTTRCVCRFYRTQLLFCGCWLDMQVCGDGHR